MADGDRAVLERLIGDPALAWFVARVRARVLAAGDEPLRGVVQLNDPSDEQRAAVVRLVGRPRRAGASLRVDLAVVEEILRRGPWPTGLADAVETLGGPVRDRGADRARETAAWGAAREELAPAIARFPQLARWWDDWCEAGKLKRSARAEAARSDTTTPTPAVGAALVRSLTTVLEMLPASGQPLAVLAREAVGDAHGLDATRPLGRLAAAAVTATFAPDGAMTADAMPTREVWAAAGVVLSNVSSTVLCLGVPGAAVPDGAAGHTPRTATATSLEAMRAARMPVLMTLDQVRSGGLRALPPDGLIHVCENPTVVEVVARRWARPVAPGTVDAAEPVVVCTSGQPSTATVELLERLAGEGAQCRYHGDFDWPGLRIAASLAARVPWSPWRFTAEDYRAAVREGKPSRPLTGSPASSPWDPRLAAAMAEVGLTVEEEAVADLLAADVLAPREP